MSVYQCGDSLGVAVAAEIRAEMARQQVTVVALARDIGVRRATLSSHLNARSQVTFSLASQAARGLGVSVTELTGRAEARIAAANDAGSDAHRQSPPEGHQAETGAVTES